MEQLLKILVRRDDRLLPVFFDALEATDQKHIADDLRENVQQQQQKRLLQGEHTILILILILY